jgi:hypothetical protein
MVTAITIAAFLSTTAISLAPNVILFLFPNYKPSNEGINPLAIGQALAAGKFVYTSRNFLFLLSSQWMHSFIGWGCR